MRAPRPRQSEQVLHVLLRSHPDSPVVVQIRDPHRELQWEALREAARDARQRRLVVHSRPTVCERFRIALGVGFLSSSGAFTLPDRTRSSVPEHVRRTDDLFEHAINEFLSCVAGVLALRQLQRGRCQQLLHEQARRQLPAGVVAQFAVKASCGLLRINFPRLVAERHIARL